MKTSTFGVGGVFPNPDRQAQMIKAILALVGLLLSIAGWLRWVF